jgi:hypothetical protein
MDLQATGRPGIAWPFFVVWFLSPIIGLIALSLSGRFVASPWSVVYYHEEKAT